VGGSDLRRQVPQHLDDLALGGKATFFAFREEGLIADADDEDAAAAADELTIEAEAVFDGGRQTGGPREVVSNAAVIDSNGHGFWRSPY
jgi:hypothetical protein